MAAFAIKTVSLMKYKTTDLGKRYVAAFVAAQDLEAEKHKVDAKTRDFSTIYTRTSIYIKS